MELKSGEKIKVVRNGACLSNENKNCMPLATGKVGENEVEVLRDTDCNGVIVRRELVKKEDFTGSMGYVMAIDRTLKEAPIAEIKMDTPYYTGVTQAICLRDPLFDLVIGNIPEAWNPDDPVFGVETCAIAVTRAQARKDITNQAFSYEGNDGSDFHYKKRIGKTATRGHYFGKICRSERCC